MAIFGQGLPAILQGHSYKNQGYQKVSYHMLLAQAANRFLRNTNLFVLYKTYDLFLYFTILREVFTNSLKSFNHSKTSQRAYSYYCVYLCELERASLL